jgi:hypothetical protein
MEDFIMKKVKVKELWDWVISNPVKFIVFLALLALIIFLGYLLVKLIILPLLGFAFLIWILCDCPIPKLPEKQPPPPILDDDSICQEVTKGVFAAVSGAGSSLGSFIVIPSKTTAIFDNSDYRGVYNGTTSLKLRFLKKREVEISPEDCEYIRNVLQFEIEAWLLDGYLQGLLWAVPVAADVPLIKIAAVKPLKLYISITVLLTNTIASVQAARLSDKLTLPPSADDTDPLFK